MFGLKTEQIATIKNILKKHLTDQERVYVFGSRVGKKYKVFSDLDLCIVSDKKNVHYNKILDIRTDYENSDLPIKIDIVFYNSCSAHFRKIIDSNKIDLFY